MARKRYRPRAGRRAPGSAPSPLRNRQPAISNRRPPSPSSSCGLIFPSSNHFALNDFAIFFLLSLLPSLAFPQNENRSFTARMLYQGLSEDIERAKPFYRDRSYSSALFHLVRALERSKELVERYPNSVEAAEAKPFMDTIRDVIEKMDAACAEVDRVRCGYVYVERLRKPEAEEACAFLKRMMAKQSTIDESLDRGHWSLAVQQCKALEKSVSEFSLANPDSLVFYPLMVLLDELSDREIEAESSRLAYEDAHAELTKQKQALLRGKLTARVKRLKGGTGERLAPIQIRTDSQARTMNSGSSLTSDRSRVTPSSPEEMAQKRALIRTQLSGRLAQAKKAPQPAIRLPYSPIAKPQSPSPQSPIRAPQLPPVSPLPVLRSSRAPSLPSPVGAGIAEALVARQLATANDLREAGRTQEALDYYGRVLRATKDNELAQKVAQSAAGMILSDHESGRDLEVRLQACNDWFSDLDRSSLQPVARLAVAQQLFRRRRLAQAEAQAAALIKDEAEGSPVARQAQMLLALCHLHQDKREQGLALLRDLASSKADDELAARAQFFIGWYYVSSQQYAQAVAAYHDLTKRFPQSRYASRAAKFRRRLAHLAKR